MYKITEKVETGHLGQTGGSLKITLSFDDVIDTKEYEEIVDGLDHSVITDDENVIPFSERFFLLEKCNNLFHDVHDVLSYFLFDGNVKNIEVRLDNKTYSAPPKVVLSNPVLKFSTKG